MQCKLSRRSTFKPRLESLETRDLPSAAGIGLYMLSQNIQQGVQAMQSQASAAQNDFKQLALDVQANNTAGETADPLKLAGAIQAARALNTQIQAELQVFNQAVVGIASDGDQGDQTLAIFSYLQVNGLSSFAGSSSGGSLASQAQNALNQINSIATATTLTLPNGKTLTINPTYDQILNS